MFKFCCYVSIPVLMTVFIAGNPARLEAIIRNVLLLLIPCYTDQDAIMPCPRPTCVRVFQCQTMVMALQRAYVVYPPEGPRPPTAEELMERIAKSKR